jgi:heat shock protein HtpX
MVWNQIKTAILLAALAGVLLVVGWLIGGYAGLTIGLAIALVINGISYFFSDKIVLFMYRAKKLEQKDAPKLHEMVEEIAKEAGIPKPKVYLVPTENANAFATGRNPKNAVVAVTSGILKILKDDELKGVLAHEISHVKNRDILISTVAATIATVISYAAMMARFASFGGDRDNNGGLLSLILLGILSPLIAMILQLAISRSREYLADATGAKLIKNPNALADALLKIDESAKTNPLRFGNRTTSSLFIANPFRTDALLSLFSTHPPMRIRVERLRAMRL